MTDRGPAAQHPVKEPASAKDLKLELAGVGHRRSGWGGIENKPSKTWRKLNPIILIQREVKGCFLVTPARVRVAVSSSTGSKETVNRGRG